MDARDAAVRGAAIALGGTVISGPVSLALIAATHPQPPWTDPDTFARSFHWIQAMPYFTGLLIIGGFVLLISSLHALGRDESAARRTAAVILTAAFAAMILINYAIQTTFIPALMSESNRGGPLLGAFTMANPTSLGWALEMWGYGVLGLATWLIAPVLRAMPRGRLAAATFVANGVVSVAGALITAAIPGWVMTIPGLILFGGWNALVVAMMLLTIRTLR